MTDRKYDYLIPRGERILLEKALMMESGYVLDFSDRTFDAFFFETLNIEPSTKINYFNGRGTSKANRLRSFIERAPAHIVTKLLRELWNYRVTVFSIEESSQEKSIKESYFKTIERFEGLHSEIDSSEIETFEVSETLDELVASIKRDLDAGRPQATIERLHTYCMKRFSALVRKHGGGDCGENEALHARVGKYVKYLKNGRNLTEMSERIIKSSISVFESMNDLRNNQSFAHDNPTLVPKDEARFVFDSVTAVLRFIKTIDSKSFED